MIWPINWGKVGEPRGSKWTLRLIWKMRGNGTQCTLV